jgi:uracil-DNA glycosylase
LELIAPEDVRVVILGQDPYHTPGKANGLAFGYNESYTGPVDSSLYNIIEEIESSGYPTHHSCNIDGIEIFSALVDRSLESWARQGVLLLNTRLTVETGKPMSHAGIGWEPEITNVLRKIDELHGDKVVWLLWGAEAIKSAEKAGVTTSRKNVIHTSHPCRFSNNATAHPFSGSHCFRRANEYLESVELNTIKWAGE